MGLAERFARYGSAQPDERGCIIWTGTVRPDGYGVLGRGARGTGLARAHRLAWELANGPIRRGLYVCHRCDRPACVNVAHLFLGTQHDNMRDCFAKGRGRPGGKAHHPGASP